MNTPESNNRREFLKLSALAGLDGANARLADARRLLDVAVTRAYVAVLLDDETARRSHQQRVTIGCTFREHIVREHAAGTGTIIDHDLLPPCFGHLLPDFARDDIAGSAGRKRRDDSDRPHRIRIGSDQVDHVCPAATAEVQERLVSLGADLAAPATPTEFGSYLAAQIEQSRQLIKASGAVPD